MDDIKDIIGKNIRIIRKQRGQTLKSLSEQIGITHQQLSRIENGSGTSTSTLERIAEILNVDMSALIDNPNETLRKSITQSRNYVPESVCQSMYAKLLYDFIKPVNDTTLHNYLDEIYEKIALNPRLIRNLMCKHAGKQESYNFTDSELLIFCKKMFFEFADYATRLSKVETEEDDDDWKDEV